MQGLGEVADERLGRGDLGNRKVGAGDHRGAGTVGAEPYLPLALGLATSFLRPGGVEPDHLGPQSPSDLLPGQLSGRGQDERLGLARQIIGQDAGFLGDLFRLGETDPSRSQRGAGTGQPVAQVVGERQFAVSTPWCQRQRSAYLGRGELGEMLGQLRR